MPASKRPSVQPHPLVKALVPDPSQPPVPSIKLVGLPGDSPAADTTRLWLDASLTSYVDVPTAAILHTQSLPDDGGTVLWVEADAELTYGTVTSHAAHASFLSGSIADAYLASAGAAGAGAQAGPIPTPPVTLASACACVSRPGACPSLPICPSETMPPSHCGGCPSLPICPSETMPPSHCGPCPTHQVWCQPSVNLPACQPTWPVWCRPTSPLTCRPSIHVICPTPSAVGGCPSAQCPSVRTICPTPSAVGGCPSVGACPSVACGSVGCQPGGGA